MTSASPVSPEVASAVEALRSGGAVVIVGEHDHEVTGEIAFAAQSATPELVSFAVAHTTGLIRVALSEATADRLSMPPLTLDRRGPASGVVTSVDAAAGITTGTSAADRARTIGVLGAATSTGSDLRSPGAVTVIRTGGGSPCRHTQPEAAVELAALAGGTRAVALAAIVSATDSTRLADGEELLDFAREHELPLVDVAELLARRRPVGRIERAGRATMPLPQGVFQALGYRRDGDSREYMALTFGDVSGREDLPVYVHSECVPGDVFRSSRCQCRARLEAALQRVADAGAGAVVYLKEPESSTGSLLSQLVAFQSGEPDVASAGDDLADAATVALILDDLNVASIRLLGECSVTSSSLLTNGVQVSAVTSLELAPISSPGYADVLPLGPALARAESRAKARQAI